MTSLRLTPNGIFPIIYDKDGKKLDNKPQTGYTFPGTIQGEGKLAGVTSLFIRTSGCNLSCKWLLPNGNVSQCDSPESSINIKEQVSMSLDDIMAVLKHNIGHIKHLVITGGEPTLQTSALITLVSRIKSELGLHITLESNCTQFNSELHSQIDLISLSPKLSSAFAGKHSQSHFKRTRECIKQVAALRKNGVDFQLKFVTSNYKDILEIKTLIKSIKEINGHDILLMPLGCNDSELSQTRKMTSLCAIENRWRYSPRIHIDIWGDRMGV